MLHVPHIVKQQFKEGKIFVFVDKAFSQQLIRRILKVAKWDILRIETGQFILLN